MSEGVLSLGRAKSIVVGSLNDTLSRVQLQKVLGMLAAAHPRRRFIDYHEHCASGRSRNKGQSFTWLTNLLVKGDADVVIVNASKIPIRIPPTIEIAVVPERDNPFDVLISLEELILDEQPENASLAVRDDVRMGQLLYYRPDLMFVKERGGFDRLNRQMEKGKINGFVITASEVEALSHQNKVVEVFTSSICMPIAGQGALGLITRRNDRDVQQLLKAVNDPASETEVELERMFLSAVAKDGKGPVGVLGSVEGTEFRIEAAIASPDGKEKVSGTMMGSISEEAIVIEKLAEELLAAGGRKIIDASKRSGEAC
jgi:hydroxymethylbilane synthase